MNVINMYSPYAAPIVAGMGNMLIIFAVVSESSDFLSLL